MNKVRVNSASRDCLVDSLRLTHAVRPLGCILPCLCPGFPI